MKNPPCSASVRLALYLTLTLVPCSATAGDGVSEPGKTAGTPAHIAAASDPAASPAREYFGDTPLVDQDGHEVRFYSDLLAGKVVVMDFVFTRCVGACPVLSGAFARIQDHLGDRLGRDVQLLSFSVDPAYDTPERLREYAGRFHARPGWRFLTGTPENVAEVLGKLGQWTAAPDQHQNLILLGNDRTGLWKKAFGLAKAEELFAIVDSVANDGGAGQEGGPAAGSAPAGPPGGGDQPR